MRSLIWTPDASRALALLGNTPDAFGQTWHLPVPGDWPNYREFTAMAGDAFGRGSGYTVVPWWVLNAAGFFSRQVRELRELLPRYKYDNRFDSTKFATRFPEFTVTPYREGLSIIRREADAGRPQ
ncbi:hypothetical protein AB0280_16190 [Pseudarthrobacter sp902506025]|uniref:hypothetical protein n=1 Tax=Pseudarthrobacter sp. 902506025 TaxID=3155291 RepID=UPI00344B15CE